MNPLIVFDCRKVIPNHFTLALAAAARARALNRGAGPRIDEEALTPSELALLIKSERRVIVHCRKLLDD